MINLKVIDADKMTDLNLPVNLRRRNNGPY